MKRFAITAITAISLAALTSSGAFAQGKTRAEVYQELQELESVGYDPSMGDGGNSYPDDIQAAEAKVAARHQAERSAALGLSQTRQTTPTP
ncbi:DUF4148 domain-containing protein [Burkholderia guangdongensis]|uniref:DUF4148 domain-containing protein n=1 Tax=Burkholderia guangdongensis TaxID=1792500 RepID=UPI0015CDD621|nr:DUF4148 domain-containing protein [Burkholderia guangdongensis]